MRDALIYRIIIIAFYGVCLLIGIILGLIISNKKYPKKGKGEVKDIETKIFFEDEMTEEEKQKYLNKFK